MSPSQQQILIVGGGASGLLVAVNLLRESNSCLITVAEPNERLGKGVAYGTTDPDHMLNVPAGRMSGLVDKPNDFTAWAGVDEGAFISRKIYGEYLEDLLGSVANLPENGDRFRHYRAEVIDLVRTADGYLAQFSDGNSANFDVVVLAIGNSEPQLPGFLAGLVESERYVKDMWRSPISGNFGRVAFIGTGLSFYDAALSISRQHPNGKLYGISRTGLLPSPHLRHRAPALPTPDLARTSAQGIRDYLVGAGEKWREAQDGIRHDLQAIWAAFPDSEKRIFLDQYFRWWNSLRHRSAPEVDERVKRLIDSGNIALIATDILEIADNGSEFIIDLANGEQLLVDQIINCCGYQLVATHALLKTLFAKGLTVRGPLGLGVKCEPETLRLIDESGQTHRNLFGIGPILIGELFETTAIPEIRVEAAQIAKSIADSSIQPV